MKYPRTPHLQSSLSKSPDDIALGDESLFSDKFVVVTEKMDGECTGMTQEKVHARSEDSRDHTSRHWVKALHAEIRDSIPKGMEIFGENMYAQHSIIYENLPSYFLVFNIAYEGKFLSWDKVESICQKLGLQTVPVLYMGPMLNKSFYDGKSKFGGLQEGYVIRNYDSFPVDKLAENCGKWVRLDHVQTDEHWMNKTIIKNGLTYEKEARYTA